MRRLRRLIILAWRWVAQSAIREESGSCSEAVIASAFITWKWISKKNITLQRSIRRLLRDSNKLSAWAGELDPPGLATGEMSRAATGYFNFYLDGTNVDLNTRTGLPPRLNEAPGNASEVFAWSLSGAPEGTQADPRYRLPRGNPKPTPYPASIQKTVE